ncbi:hypothetical protein [Spiroplasma endosymbiont of Virgichneumon dumeticola]|uniref:hypothetical protein n=1 Tax=Spiroplasma endosymbiont of Virgichneumon dumeticola TaxID=3139323 RepID=UPI0035C88382
MAFLPLCTIFKFYHINAEKSLLYNAKNGMYIEELKKEEQRKKQKIELENSETFDSFNKEKEPQTNKLP